MNRTGRPGPGATTQMTRSKRPIAVIGAGFSGTLTALHLLSRTSDRQILLCERNERFGRGIAYGTIDPDHLLNVRASNMSAFPDRPEHFVHWLERTGPHAGMHRTPAGTFVSRQLYGRYLSALLKDALSGADGASRLILVPDEVIDIVPQGSGHRIGLAGGRTIEVAAAVLAISQGSRPDDEAGLVVMDPWTSPFAEGLDRSRPVVVIGSGLTMVDIVLQLHRSGFDGPIVAISRRGLLPRSHAATQWWPAPAPTAHDLTSLARMMRHLRRHAAGAEAAGVGWRSAFDSLRPYISDLWLSLDPDAQRRFLRHARPWWDIHRHRMAPPVAQRIDDLLSRGQLDVRAGWIETVAARGDHARVAYRPRGQSAVQVIEAQRVIVATGTRSLERCGNPLLHRLVDQGLARPDIHGLGLDIDPAFAVLDRTGQATSCLWAVGPLGRGVLWECTAVPDIRQHAVIVADHVVAALAGPPQADGQGLGLHPVRFRQARDEQPLPPLPS